MVQHKHLTIVLGLILEQGKFSKNRFMPLVHPSRFQSMIDPTGHPQSLGFSNILCLFTSPVPGVVELAPDANL